MIKHSKHRNTGLLYEFLLREVILSLIEEKKHKASITWNVIERYFLDKKAPLKRELEFFTVLSESNSKSREVAEKILKEVEHYAKNTNCKTLEQAKTSLLEEIKTTLGSILWKHKIDNYKFLASVQVLLNSIRYNKSSLMSEVEKIKVESSILEHLLEEREQKPLSILEEGPSLDDFVITVALRKFNGRYKKKLNPPQKRLLESYMLYQLNKIDEETFKDMMRNAATIIKEQINVIANEDTKLRDQLVEASQKLNEVVKVPVSDDSIIKFMEYLELSERL